FPAEKEPYLSLVLNTQGASGVLYLYRDNSKNTFSDLTSDVRLALTPGSLYHLEVLVQRNQFVLFLEKQFIAVLPLATPFPATAAPGLFTESPKGTPPSDLVFKNLTIYPLPSSAE
ncbi:MAG TPA: hypothetical protein VH590_17540, partial [Ktedonobacterales bacterium]